MRPHLSDRLQERPSARPAGQPPAASAHLGRSSCRRLFHAPSSRRLADQPAGRINQSLRQAASPARDNTSPAGLAPRDDLIRRLAGFYERSARLISLFAPRAREFCVFVSSSLALGDTRKLSRQVRDFFHFQRATALYNASAAVKIPSVCLACATTIKPRA